MMPAVSKNLLRSSVIWKSSRQFSVPCCLKKKAAKLSLRRALSLGCLEGTAVLLNRSYKPRVDDAAFGSLITNHRSL